MVPVRVRVPAPSLVKEPVPLISPPTVKSLERLKVKAALLTMPPVPKVPVVLPEPTCKVPALIVVMPV